MRTQTKETAGTSSATSRRSGIPMLGVAIALSALALIGIGAAWLGGDAEPEPGSESALELRLGESSTMASCLVFDVAVLADMPVAFGGSATAVDGSTVTLSVERWFKGGDAAMVRLVGEHTSPALIDGFEFEVGQQYLITATDGAVNYCGYSGLATPELAAGFEAAFAG